MGRDSSIGIVTRNRLDGLGIEPQWGGGGGVIFGTGLGWPGGPPTLPNKGYWVFFGGKAARAWHWPPTPSSSEVKERVELYLYSTSETSWPVIGWPLTLWGWVSSLNMWVRRRCIGIRLSSFMLIYISYLYPDGDVYPFYIHFCSVCVCVCVCVEGCNK
jgi:hypothetical protein